ncbi:S8 family serine peptidase [Thermococcus sp. 9N3]|uniref:S8 family peptidase n=1 Tax=Thermococcus sp. 9N3 TaxID=163002 RepID=UPI00143152D5|nr:S8 family serine peptidase [Thermococcus sp. 9N3]NJE49027.1 hypothetical protein [Thermococcus sp. 9N3]
MNRKVLSLLIVVVMTLAIVPVGLSATYVPTATSKQLSTSVSGTNVQIKPLPATKPLTSVAMMLNSIQMNAIKNNKSSVRLIIAPQPGKSMEVLEALKKLGEISPLSKPEYNFIVVTVPLSKLGDIKKIPGILRVWEDRRVSLPLPPHFGTFSGPIRNIPMALGSSPYLSLYDWDMEVINAPEARALYNVDGSGAVVAVIDTGADPGQPFLQTTPDGRRKIIRWIDTTGEGLVSVPYNFTNSSIINGTVTITLTNVSIDWGDYATSLVRDPETRKFVGRESQETTLGTVHLTLRIPPEIKSSNGIYRFGFLPERYFDLNFDNNLDEIYFVLLVNSSTEYDTAYLYPIPLPVNTTNASLSIVVDYLTKARIAGLQGDYAGYLANYSMAVKEFVSRVSVPNGGSYNFTVDLSRAIRLKPFDVESDYASLGSGNSGYSIVKLEVGYLTTMDVALGYTNIVVSYITPDGTEICFGWDGGEHGTHVSGTIAGYGEPNPHYPWPFNETGMVGVAPGAQLMEYRALSSIGYGSDSWIIASMIDAATSGADIISMSLGGNYDYNDGTESPENYYVDYLTYKFNVTFVIAAGNEGPAMNTVGSPGDSRFAITVGAYVDPEPWKYFSEGPNVPPQVTDFSSRGPRMDGLNDPDVIAPGQFVFSLLPVYTYGESGSWASDWWPGTSMATPHVSGVAALLVSYARKKGIPIDPFKIKEAIEFSAKPIPGYNLNEQGFGLVQADAAIKLLSEIAKDKTSLLYIGTPYSDLKTQLHDNWLPVGEEFINYEYNIPYLYGGIYIRNSRVATVPVKIYALKYQGTLTIRSSVPWAIPSVSKISLRSGENTTFYVTIDYSKLATPGIYTGIIYIDDPSTTYIEGYIPVTIFVPEAPQGGIVRINDTYKDIGDNVHRYLFKVPENTQRMIINISTDSGNYLWMQLVPPTGTHILNALGYGGFGLRNRVIKIDNPMPGTWELIIWNAREYNTGLQFHSNITIHFYGLTANPSTVYVDSKINSTAKASVVFENSLDSLNVSFKTTTNTTLYYGDLWYTNGVLNGYTYEFYIDSYYNPDIFKDAVYLEVTVLPERPLQDIYVEAGYGLGTDYPTILSTSGGTLQIPLLNNSLPAYLYIGSDDPAYVLLTVIYKNSTRNIVKVVNPGPAKIMYGDIYNVHLQVNTSSSGTYIGALYATGSDGALLSVVPVFVQVGMPTMFAVLYGKAELGKPSNLKLVLFDAKTLKPISGAATVYINGNEYLAVDGVVDFTMIPTSSEEELNVKVVSPNYQDLQTTLTLHVSEPVTKPVYSYDEVNATVALGQAVIVNITRKPGEVDVIADGPHGTNATITVILPEDAYNVRVTGADVLGWHVVKGKNAVYVVVTVVFNSPAEFTVTYLETTPTSTGTTIIPFMSLNYLYYHYIQTKNVTFQELYQKALQEGVNETLLQQAMVYYNQSMAEYKTAEDIAGGFILGNLGDFRLFIHLRKSYADLKKAIRLLQEALEAQGS